MDQQRWEQIKDLFEKALELAPEARAAFLAQACGGNAALRSEVEALLDHDRRAGGFLEESDAADFGIRAIARVDHPTLSPGEVLSGRFRIVQFLGRGGMGEVYEAKDLELGERIALKTIRPEIAFEPRSLARFKQEIQLARRVTHPNVCRMFDLGRCQTGPGATVITFLTMELIKGETLAVKLRSQGRMMTAEALPLIQQMADALAAAHDVGVVHRDFKPGNVMLASAKTDAKVMRVVVTDFGLAKAVAVSVDKATGENTASSVTSSGHHPGTLAYMAPEQMEGREATPAADVYALGLVMYEMLVGRKPFPEDAPLAGALLRLREDPASPRVYVPDFDRHWERVLLRCLTKNPAGRFATARELLESLDNVSSAVRSQHSAAIQIGLNHRKRGINSRHDRAVLGTARAKHSTALGTKDWRLVVAGVFLAGLIAMSYRYLHRPPKLTEKDTVVIGDFTNTTDDPVFDDALRQALSVQLEQSPFLSVISDSQTEETLRMMGRAPYARLTPQVAQELCRRIGSAAALEGSITQIGTQYNLVLTALDCSNGELLAGTEARADDKNHVLGALGELASEMRGKLGESLRTAQKFDTPVEQATTPSLVALQAYSLGEKNFDDYVAAIPFLQRAIRLDPKFAMAYEGLAVCFFSLGETALGAQYAEKAYKLREHVSEREKLRIEGYYYFALGDLERARQTHEFWAQAYPRDWIPRNNLGNIYRYLGQHEAALANLRQSLLIGSRNYANIVLSYLNLNRLNEARVTAAQAQVRKADSPWIHFELYLIAFLQHNEAAMAQQESWSVGKPGFESLFLSSEADTAAYFGQLAKARELSRQAIASAERAGEKESAADYEAEAVLREALFGNRAQVRQLARAALGLSTGQNAMAGVALALALAGEGARSKALSDELAKGFPDSTALQFNYLPTIHAQLELNRSESWKAIKALDDASPYELGAYHTGAFPPAMFPTYVRGQVYLAMHQGGEAAIEFQKLLDHPGLVLNEPIGALAYLDLGRAYALEAGIGVLPRFSRLHVAVKHDRPKHQQGASAADALARARAAYQDFFALWKDADPDIPILHEAKAEYANLQRSDR
jgi:eukaryotic-like serine/threonine-protein kinase